MNSEMMNIEKIYALVESEAKTVKKTELPALKEDTSVIIKRHLGKVKYYYHKVRIYIRTQLGKVKRMIIKR